MNVNQKISIIVPIYRVEPYLPDCINSLINQTYINIEIILVDDGSPDNCGKICDEYAQKDSRIKVIHKENGGVVSARNAGYESSTGDWVMYLDGDDWIDLHTCEILGNYIRHFDVDMIFWNTTFEIREQSIYTISWKSTKEFQVYQSEECKNLSLNTLIYTSGIATSYSKLLKRQFCEENRLIQNTNLTQALEGVEFSMRVFYAAHSALFINKFLTHYLYIPTAASKRMDDKRPLRVVDAFIEMQKFINHIPEKTIFQKALYQRTLYALIATAIAIYFHPNNKDSIFLKIAKFKSLIRENECFYNALKYGELKELDIFRRITIYMIKYKLYLMLSLIAFIKYSLLKPKIYV